MPIAQIGWQTDILKDGYEETKCAGPVAEPKGTPGLARETQSQVQTAAAAARQKIRRRAPSSP
jgi:hypothetical protein